MTVERDICRGGIAAEGNDRREGYLQRGIIAEDRRIGAELESWFRYKKGGYRQRNI